MIKTLAFITQYYITFASDNVFRDISRNYRVILFIHDNEELDSRLAVYFDQVYKVAGSTTKNIRPELSCDEICKILEAEIQGAGGPHHLSIFCQQEDNILVAAQVRDRLNILGDSASMVKNFRDKIQMKQTVEKALPGTTPRYTEFDLRKAAEAPYVYYQGLVEYLGSKIIIKPVDGSGSLNVKIVENFNHFQDFLHSVAKDRYQFNYEADTFIGGNMYQCDSLVIDGAVKFAGILELGCSNFDFVMGQPLSVFPVSDETLYKKLFNFNQAVISALGFSTGSTHHEVFISNDDRIVFLEIAARVPGGIGVPFHAKNSGINLVDATILLAVQDRSSLPTEFKFKNNIVAALLPVGEGRVENFCEPDIESDYEINWYVKKGMHVSSNSLIDTAGMLTFWNDELDILRKDFERIQSYVPIQCSVN